MSHTYQKADQDRRTEENIPIQIFTVQITVHIRITMNYMTSIQIKNHTEPRYSMLT